MAYFTILLTYYFLWCISHGEAMCINPAICVANVNEAECQARPTVYNLSLIPEKVKNCEIVDIKITSGIHIMSEDLRFRSGILRIHGSEDGNQSVVYSGNFTFFFQELEVVISHLNFRNGEHYPALYFAAGVYKLYDVMVENNRHGGVYAVKCRKEWIVNSTLRRSLHFSFSSRDIVISNCDYDDTSLTIEPPTDFLNVTVDKTRFVNNLHGALHVSGAGYLVIRNCEVLNNTGQRTIYINTKLSAASKTTNAVISTKFVGNLEALYIVLDDEKNPFSSFNISNCTFQSNNLSQIVYSESKAAAVTVRNTKNNVFTIENTIFEGNFGNDGNCSSLEIINSKNNMTLKNILIKSNHCTGIALYASNITIQNWLNVTRNFGKPGGAIEMISVSTITLNSGARLNLVENTAKLYGGGIYVERACDSQEDCFFQAYLVNRTTIKMAGNRAQLGGDAIFGGCLFDCHIEDVIINITDPKNIVYEMISLKDNPTASIFAELPKQVVFCCNTSKYPVCNSKKKVHAYRGETFRVPLMIASNICFPTIGFIKATVKEAERAKLGDLDGVESYKKSNKYCDIYKYTVEADINLSSVTIELSIHSNLPLSYSPALLTVMLDDCPIGYQFNSTERKCACSDLLKAKQIKCITSTYSLEVPALTWIGKIDGKEAVNKHCQYCHSEGDVTIHKIEDTNKLCAHNREGILCGRCSGNYSLLLGGHKCGYCSKSVHRGVLLTLGFALIGVATVLLLLRLNLTVSTGLINGLIFYSNIVYANHDIFLPINQERDSQSSLDVVVSLLSTFLAWMNLDFGIVTCFFDGYNTYISAWMQFIFPLYIWLLICTIVLASRYSNRISRITTSNTVSVLATLLLLSYAKLLTTAIEVSSFTDAIFLNGSSRHRVWVLDGTILYLHGRHVPLFIVSMIAIMMYLLPFTLLILLGPLLQAKSHYRLLKWVNKLKPFLDAFYGPYRSRYRYWPGILLLARLAILNMFAYYSLGDSPFKLVVIFVMVIILLLTWIVLGINHNLSLHYQRHLNFLELFFFWNLSTFAVSSMCQFSEKHIKNQQKLALVMVGSVLVVFFCIVLRQIVSIAIIRKAISRFITLFPANFVNNNEIQDNILNTAKGKSELREPLLI